MATSLKQLAKIRHDYFKRYRPYKMTYWEDYQYEVLDNIIYRKRSGGGSNDTYNDVIIMADTETSKKSNGSDDNHVVAWTITLRAFNLNIVTLWGRKPSDFVTCVKRLMENMQGKETIIYFHNMPYDYTFLRQFIFKEFGYPIKQLNVKSHYPILIQWEGLTFKDSLILAQRSLDKWAKDMNVEHQKVTGKWDYNKIRNQAEQFTADELEYIEHDTLAGAECINALMNQLHKSLYSLPYTATGIPREEVYKRGCENKARDLFKRNHLSFEQYLKGLKIYHGGYTHANRHLINNTIKGLIKCKDFASSYPAVLLTEKYPSTNFIPIDCDAKFILENSENHAFMFKLILLRPRLKDDSIPMPVLQLSKADQSINVIADNGRVLCAEYFSIYITEQDLKLIMQQYNFDECYVTECETAEKDYLPRWFTDYIFELFIDKTTLKGAGDPVLYAIKKATLNSIYGLCCQKSIRDEIIEDYDSGEFNIINQMTEEAYEKYLSNRKSILLYQTGIYVTAYAMVNLFKLGLCVDYEHGGEWLYSDTDSCYSNLWDDKKVEEYNNNVKSKLIANNYGPVLHNGREYWLGVAEDDSEYIEFRFQGAKRYCGRGKEDNQLHITVAGVPKKTGAKCLNDNIENFAPGLVFDGKTTGKLTRRYIYVDEIYVDENGNETGDSIDLIPCDYLLDSVYVTDWRKVFDEEIEVGGYYGE